MKRISELQLLKVYTEEGDYLGHVFDLRSARPAKAGTSARSCEIGELVYGALGLLEHLGLRRAKSQTIAWSSVIALRGKRLIVRAKGRAKRR